jgi:hypothetical protein
MDVVEDEAQRALLAEALLAETKPPEESEVESAIQEIQERAIESRQRDLRAQIAEAERRGDFAELALLTQQKARSGPRAAPVAQPAAAGAVAAFKTRGIARRGPRFPASNWPRPRPII